MLFGIEIFYSETIPEYTKPEVIGLKQIYFYSYITVSVVLISYMIPSEQTPEMTKNFRTALRGLYYISFASTPFYYAPITGKYCSQAIDNHIVFIYNLIVDKICNMDNKIVKINIYEIKLL
jgi:hypothetical protein